MSASPPTNRPTDLEPAVHEPLVVQLLEHPPHALHVRRVQRLVVVAEVDPPPHASDLLLPFGGVAHHNGAALLVVFRDADPVHTHDLGAGFRVGDGEGWAWARRGERGGEVNSLKWRRGREGEMEMKGERDGMGMTPFAFRV